MFLCHTGLLWEGLVLGGSTEDMVEQYLVFSASFSISGGVGRGSATAAWSSSKTNVLQSIPLQCIVCHLHQSDSYHLWTK